MIESLALILAGGFLCGKLFKKIGFPALFGMLLYGMLIGPYGLNWIDGGLMDISANLRSLALIIILARAGLNLEWAALKKAGLPALLMCFVPALFEIAATVILAPVFFGLSLIDSLLLGSVLAAVSPAVIVPHMLRIMEQGYGTRHAVPQVILTGASADDILVIALFGIFLQLAQGGGFNGSALLDIPLSIGLGILSGLVLGWGLKKLFDVWHPEDYGGLLVFLSLCFFLYALESRLPFAFSGLLAIMVMGIVLHIRVPRQAASLSRSCSALWYFFEILLFVLVGAVLNYQSLFTYGLTPLLMIVLILCARMAGVYVSLLFGKYEFRERLFCMVAYLPKATVQAAIGAVPLAAGLESGSLILTLAIMAVLITAPIGAFLIDLTYKKWLDAPISV